MTAEEMQSVIVYLTDKIEKLEQQKLCECGKNEVSTPEYKTTPKGIVICYHQSEKYSFATSYVKNHIGELKDIDIYTHDFTDEKPPPN